MRSGAGLAVGVLCAVVSMSLGARCGEAPVVQDDADGDGFVASTDNCTERANPDQRDSDRDGAGDACDADYDQNGRVGVSDFSAFRRVFGFAEGQTRFDRRFDHNGDGRIGLPDFNVLRSSFGGVPGPFADDDGDGVPVAFDLCPGGVAGEDAVGHGCSVLDIAARPRAIFEPLIEGLDMLRDEIGRVPRLEPYNATGALGTASATLAEALVSAGRANPCAGHRTALGADPSLEDAIAAVAIAQRHLITDGPPAGDADAGDTTEWDFQVSELDHWLNRLVRKREVVADAVGLLDMACQQTRPFSNLRARIRRFDGGERRIELDDGRIFALAEGFRLRPVSPITGYDGLSEGDEANFYGLAAGNGAVVTEAGALAMPTAQPPQPLRRCLDARFAPWQRFTRPPLEVELHEPIAYFADGRYRLESGMRIGAESFCRNEPGQMGSVRYTMDIRATANGGTQVLATDYTPSQVPVALPSAGAGTLTIRIHAQDCSGSLISSCGPKQEQSSTDYPYIVRPHWLNCRAVYGSSDRTYTVDDRISGDFAREQLSTFFVQGDTYYDPGTIAFEAEGYEAPVGQVSSTYPFVNPINVGDSFAIHNSDFFPIFGELTDAERTALVTSQGVQHAAGLRWPRMRGTLSGRPFAYSCYVPPITARDAIDLCPNDPTHAFYQLPFENGDDEWAQGQGNDGSFTHSGGFAYDMGAPLDSRILVARSGRVADVKEDEYRQCCANGCDVQGSQANPCPRGNYLLIEHEDGSVGQYVHMPQNGVVPQEGDIVRRGDRVGRVGVTGNTTGPHLHFAARNEFSNSSTTRLALFEALNPEDESELLTCHEPPNREHPAPPEPLRSTNEER